MLSYNALRRLCWVALTRKCVKLVMREESVRECVEEGNCFGRTHVWIISEGTLGYGLQMLSGCRWRWGYIIPGNRGECEIVNGVRYCRIVKEVTLWSVHTLMTILYFPSCQCYIPHFIACFISNDVEVPRLAVLTLMLSKIFGWKITRHRLSKRWNRKIT